MQNNYEMYSEIIRPSWAPPAWIFSPVWTILYILIFIALLKTISLYVKKKIAFIVLLPFILNLFFNLIFTPIQFGLKNYLLASIDIVLVLATLIWFMLAMWRHNKVVVYLLIPYLLWVSFATVLQITVTVLNW